jgi:MFS family permease
MSTLPPRDAASSWLRAALLYGAQFLLTAEIGVLHLALPDLMRWFALDAVMLQLVNVVYMAALALMLLPAGILVDRTSPVAMFRTGASLLAAGSALGALAPSLGWVFLARAAQGAGGGLLLPAALALLARGHTAGPARERAMAWWSLAAVLGAVLGTLGGGLMAAATGWRGAFGAGALLAAPLVLARSEAARTAPRGNAVIGFAAIRDRSFQIALVAASLHGMGPQAVLFYLGLRLQGQAGWSAGEAGVALLPAPILAPVGVMLGLRLVRAAGCVPPLALGLAAMAASLALLASAPTQPGYLSDILPGLVALGVGSTLVTVPMYVLATEPGPAEDLGSRSGLLYVALYLGPAFFLTAITGFGGGDAQGAGSALALGAALFAGGTGSVLLLAAAPSRVAGPAR